MGTSDEVFVGMRVERKVCGGMMEHSFNIRAQTITFCFFLLSHKVVQFRELRRLSGEADQRLVVSQPRCKPLDRLQFSEEVHSSRIPHHTTVVKGW